MSFTQGDLPAPSDFLAEIAAVIHKFELRDAQHAREWASSTDFQFLAPKDEWLLDPAAVVERARQAGQLKQPVESPTDKDAFCRLIDAAQILDRWHRPLVPAPLNQGGQPLPLPHHEPVILEVPASRPYFGSCDAGIIVPRHTMIMAQRDEPEEDPPDSPLLFGILNFTAYLPRSVTAVDQDQPAKRQVLLTYQTLLSTNPIPEGLIKESTEAPFKVAIAPLLEQEKDVEWRFSPDGTRYAIAPNYRKDRLRQVVKNAIERGIHLLIMPEASVLAANLPYLGRVIEDETAKFLRVTGSVPRLLYVIAGVTGPAETCPDTHVNFVCVLNSSGEELFRQHKMFRWDIRTDQIDRFRLREHYCLATSPDSALVESIGAPKDIVLADFSDIGRLLNLICADITFDLPGDWFFHLGIDWLNAPIFDQYVGPFPAPAGEKLSWICARSKRAAHAGTRVIVSNSVALTCRLKAANEERNDPRPGLDPCGIGLLIDGAHSPRSFLRMEVPLSEPSPMLVVGGWRIDWLEMQEPVD